ncbi:MAG: D-glycerate 2-kinase (EC [uncultured Sulfurovum sp.]|uniref:D-glycerate 2-kinase (EC) n=1 Tax=uncultured Sulfurovum sp. TaxID=269237 RepID=A0A6S6TJY3_9BACT|nr:MAG: D-glycerate 2-kinase (EC [uncultured Sulfurovum sp.]
MSNKTLLTTAYHHALNAVKADIILAKNLSINSKNLRICEQNYALKSFKNLYCFSVGKAGLAMAKACEEILGEHLAGGLAISHQKAELLRMEHVTSTHPLVSKKSLKATDKLISTMKEMEEDDFFIFCLSGGASAMIEKPIEGLSLEDFQQVSVALLGSGIDIKALNSVRKSISQIKGGKLAQHSKAKGVVLVLSDVIGDDLKTIGSAPMRNGEIPHHIIGNNAIALKEAKKFMANEVDKVKIITTTLNQSSKDATAYIAQNIKEYNKKYNHFCLLFGGETTTKVKGEGQGGRNQELALRLLLKEVVNKKITILVAGSDGIDGNSPATGAFIDFDIYDKIKKKGLDPKSYLKNSDSYGFFKALGYDFSTGATGTNVMDFIIILKK